jgi:hypothetical protein
MMASSIRTGFTAHRLTAGRGGSVLVADFQPVSTLRRLGELLGDQGPDLAVCQLDPAQDLTCGAAPAPLDEMAAEYATSFQAVDSAPHTTVIGYCSAAALALRIADRLAPDRRVEVLLARPTWPDDELIGLVLAKIRSDLGAETSSDTEASAGLDLSGTAAESLSAVEELLRADLRALAATHGLDPDSGPMRELLGRFRGWLGFLLTARSALRSPWVRGLSVHVCADVTDNAYVPWFEPGSYAVATARFSEDEAAAGAELALALLGRLGDRRLDA